MFKVLPPDFPSPRSMVGTFVNSDLIEEIFTTETETFEEMDKRIVDNDYSSYFIEYKGLVFKFVENHLYQDTYFVGMFDETLEFDDNGNMKTLVDVKNLKELLSNIGVSSPRIVANF